MLEMRAHRWPQQRRGPSAGYLPGLDGLRAISVAAVLLYHADLPWMPGGFLGVEVFFVISGYLITLLLTEEHSRTRRSRCATSGPAGPAGCCPRCTRCSPSSR